MSADENIEALTKALEVGYYAPGTLVQGSALKIEPLAICDGGHYWHNSTSTWPTILGFKRRPFTLFFGRGWSWLCRRKGEACETRRSHYHQKCPVCGASWTVLTFGRKPLRLSGLDGPR